MSRERAIALPLALLLALLALGLGPAGCGEDRPPAEGVEADGGTGGDAGGDGGGAETRADGSGALGLAEAPAGGYKAVFLDVGQGDATLLIDGQGRTLLIDAGRTPQVLLDRLGALGVKKLDAVVVSHGDVDHIGGVAAALEKLDVERLYWNGFDKDTGVFDAMMAAAGQHGVETHVVQRGDTLPFGKIDVQVLHPAKETGDANDDSVVLMAGCSGAWLLLPGDAGVDAESDMLAAGTLSSAQVLHLAHHGSKNSTSAALLDKVKPRDAIVSAGLKNAFGHPHKVVIDALQARGVAIWRTDLGPGDDTLAMTTACKASYSIAYVH